MGTLSGDSPSPVLCGPGTVTVLRYLLVVCQSQAKSRGPGPDRQAQRHRHSVPGNPTLTGRPTGAAAAPAASAPAAAGPRRRPASDSDRGTGNAPAPGRASSVPRAEADWQPLVGAKLPELPVTYCDSQCRVTVALGDSRRRVGRRLRWLLVEETTILIQNYGHRT